MHPSPKQRTIRFLQKTTFMQTEDGRRALIISADLEEVPFTIGFGKGAVIFCPLFVDELINYGKLQRGKFAIEALLEEVGRNLGQDQKQNCDQLITEWCTWYQATSAQNKPQTKEVTISQSEKFEQILFKSLLKLDFEEQVGQVVQTIDFYPIAAFLVHGGENCGQGTLVTRLCQLRPSWRSGRYIPIDVSSNSVRGSLEMVWNLLADEFEQDPVADDFTNQLIERIFECWQTQTVIFAFKEVNRAPVGFLKQLVEKLWQPIVERVSQALILPNTCVDKQHGQQPHSLIMFLVDNEGYICNLNILPLAWNFKQPDYPRVPLSLQPTNRIPLDKLQSWLVMAVEDDVLPENLTVDVLLTESSGGIPQLIYKKVCEYCGCSWEGGLTKWLV